MNPGTHVTLEGRPAITITATAIGANGVEMVGVRFTDVPKLEEDPRFEGLWRPVAGAHRLVPVAELGEGVTT